MTALFLFGDIALDRSEVISFAWVDLYGFANIARLDGIPLIQQTANPPRIATIHLQWHASLTDIEKRHNSWQQMAIRKTAHLLVQLPQAQQLGWFVIEKLSFNPTQYGADRSVYSAKLDIEIREFPADRITPDASTKNSLISQTLAARRSMRWIQPQTIRGGS